MTGRISDGEDLECHVLVEWVDRKGSTMWSRPDTYDCSTAVRALMCSFNCLSSTVDNRNKEGQGDGAGAPIETKTSQGARGQDGSTATGGDAVGDEEDEPGDNDKPPGQQRAQAGFPGPREESPTPHRQSESGLLEQIVQPSEGREI